MKNLKTTVKLDKSTRIDRQSILGIFDMDTSTVSSVTRSLLRRAQREGKLNTLEGDIPRCFVLSDDAIYTSSYSVKHMTGKLV